MTKIILAAALAFGIAGTAFAEGEGYATTGDWREIPATPAPSSVQAPSTTVPAPATTSAAPSFQFTDGNVG